MELRAYTPADCREMLELFYDTVHTINARDYSPKQLDVWATGKEDPQARCQSFLAHYTLVAVENGKIVGFGDIDSSGYLDRLYVHKDRQNQAIASTICDRLEQSVDKTITVHASITARPFFEKRGYRVIHSQQVERRGVLLTNFVMEKEAQKTK